jgi:hypothetical protein
MYSLYPLSLVQIQKDNLYFKVIKIENKKLIVKSIIHFDRHDKSMTKSVNKVIFAINLIYKYAKYLVERLPLANKVRKVSKNAFIFFFIFISKNTYSNYL